ncbi:MAG: 3'-5' exonuclease, partial [Planctomycetota bacterium]
FPRVFIVAVEDDLLPHRRSKDSEDQVEEERRLLFVGITRAQQWLHLSYCKNRTVRGDLRPVIPSPFLNELPREEMEVIDCNASRDFFEEDDLDAYPDSWDLVEEPAADELPTIDISRQASDSSDANDVIGSDAEDDRSINDGRIIPAIYGDTTIKKRSTAARKVKLQTANDLLSSSKTPLMAYREGSIVRHEDYGNGEIVSLSGRGPKRTARVRFDQTEETFRLAFAKLELVQ